MTNTHAWSSMLHAWERGGVARGNHEAVLAAEAANSEYRFGDYCPARCGSVVRWSRTESADAAMSAHTEDPTRCCKHPDARKRKRTNDKFKQQQSAWRQS